MEACVQLSHNLISFYHKIMQMEFRQNIVSFTVDGSAYIYNYFRLDGITLLLNMVSPVVNSFICYIVIYKVCLNNINDIVYTNITITVEECRFYEDFIIVIMFCV